MNLGRDLSECVAHAVGVLLSIADGLLVVFRYDQPRSSQVAGYQIADNTSHTMEHSLRSFINLVTFFPCIWL